MSATSKVALVNPALGGLGLGQLDGGGRKVKSDGGVAPFREIQRDRGLTAADVEDFAVELALLDQCRESPAAVRRCSTAAWPAR